MQLYQFLWWFDDLLPIGVEFLEEYITNYDLEDGLSVVKEIIYKIGEII